MADQQLVHSLYGDIAKIITQAQNTIRSTANSAMVITYWNIGRLLVENEQSGKQRAEYGQQTLKKMSEQLTQEFGKGFDSSNLKRMRQFYTLFSKGGAVSHPLKNELSLFTDNKLVIPNVHLALSWTHYRHLLKVDDQQARHWYMQEAVQENWSTRALERQINSFYYQRLLTSQNRKPVQEEAKEKAALLPAHDVQMKYSMLSDHQQMFASKYKLHLPSEALLAKELQRELSLLEDLQ